MANKMTQRDWFNEIIAMATDAGRDDIVEFCEGRIEVLDKKKSGSSKPTATQIANEGLKATVLNVLTDEGATVSDIMKKDDELVSLSNQKVSAILKLLIKDGKATKVVEGKKSLFKLV